MVLKYSRLTMCLVTTFAVSSPAVLAGCGDGVFTTVQGEPGARDDSAVSMKDAAVDAPFAPDAAPLDDAGLPFANGIVTIATGGCVSLPRVTVCVPPGAVFKRATMSLHAYKNDNVESATDTAGPGMYVFQVDLEAKLLKMDDKLFPCVTFDYEGHSTSNVVASQYFDRQGSRGWEPMLPFSCKSVANSVVGAIAEANDRLATGIIITAAKSCNSGSDCKTNYCSAKVCQ
jgi:hypothetical protein